MSIPSVVSVNPEANASHSQWQSALEFRALAETIPSMVFVTDSDGSNIYTNVQFQRFTGLTADALLGDGWIETLHDDDKERAAEIWQYSCATGESYEAKYRFRNLDGSYRWHLVRGVPICGPDSAIVRWMGTCTDIDEMVATIDQKTQAADILDAMAAAQRLVFYAKDEKGRFIYANDAVHDVVGVSVLELTGKTADDLTTDQGAAKRIQLNDQSVTLSGTAAIFEEMWPGTTGLRHFRSFKAPLPLPDGKTGIAAMSYEILEEATLKLSAEIADRRLDNWLEAIDLIAWESDSSGKIVAVSQAWRDAAALSPLTQDFEFSDLINTENLEQFYDDWKFALETGEFLDTSSIIFDKFDRQIKPVAITANPSRRTIEGTVRWHGSIVA